ncbi:hypothetical protein [Rhodococcus rhodochrous]|uniref:hypothetical protein n=1 Tax=Rhodococcus rhodochrous TaxID=1829 RepID=UPI001E55C4BF|nr:hypothetical protein [Rhodococcus rhodochrous]MCD2096531.1 hypothetical protein [Rhodococcus rhodochrous]MCD2121251.1 hypothetical protein [Rhodococcus rhodochrous]MCQ4137345.1 hypothetical protein [Rhodococcus rhodochrous]MDJ0021162.1 hypothetical protein [Rhodococcus rhodochrous]
MTINIHGQDGSFWPVHGEDEGAEGVVLGQGQVKGLFPVPGRTFWKSTQRQTGGTMKGLWYDPRDLLLGFHISAQRVRGGDQEDIMSRFRQALDWREDQWDHDASLAKIEVIAPSGSQRWLDIQLYEMDDFNPDIDPLVTQHANRVFPLRAGMPFYYEEPEVTTLEFTSDGAGEIEVENPTDQPMLQKWIVTRGNWTLPDVSWEGPPYQRRPGVSKQTGRDDRNRKIMLPPITTLEGGATVDLDAMSLMIRDAAGTNLLGRMPVPGRFFEYCIPPKTQRQTLPVSVTNVPAGGAMVQLVQPRWWSEPIGGQ